MFFCVCHYFVILLSVVLTAASVDGHCLFWQPAILKIVIGYYLINKIFSLCCQNVAATSPPSERVSSKPMASSSDIILTSRHTASVSDLTNGSNGAGQVRSSKPSRAYFKDGEANAAACYGVDTVHDWATVSAASGSALRREQLSSWQSDAALYSGSQTVSLDTSPVHNHQTQPPKPPPRIKRKARAPVPATLFTSPDKGMRHIMARDRLTSVVDISAKWREKHLLIPHSVLGFSVRNFVV